MTIAETRENAKSRGRVPGMLSIGILILASSKLRTGYLAGEDAANKHQATSLFSFLSPISPIRPQTTGKGRLSKQGRDTICRPAQVPTVFPTLIKYGSFYLGGNGRLYSCLEIAQASSLVV